MIHDLNLVLSFLGQRVVDVRAVGVAVMTEKVDITNVRLEFENGAVANLTASRVSQDRVRKIRFFSREAYISVDTKEQEVKGYRLAGKTVLPIEVNVTKQEPLRAELEAFVECVRTRTRPLVSGEDGLAAVELAIRVAKAIDESLRRVSSDPADREAGRQDLRCIRADPAQRDPDGIASRPVRMGFYSARKIDVPANTAASPSSSSIRSSWLYFAIRSLRDSDPVLICPAFVATARSAIVESSVSPERCEITERYPARFAISIASSVSVSVPI